MMKEMFKKFKYTKDRSFTRNLVFCIISLLGVILIPSIIGILLMGFVKNDMVNTLISNLVFCLILYLMYYKDLNKEFKTYKNNFKSNFKLGFKYYILGFIGMIFFNLLIAVFLKNISSNESQVRDMLFSSPVITFLCIALTAPFSEEIVFRKSLAPVIKNKWIYVIVCGLLFGGAHILTNILNNAFVISDLIYILPYGCLGASFALMDRETSSTFTSIVMHCLHNSATGVLLLVTYFSGLM